MPVFCRYTAEHIKVTIFLEHRSTMGHSPPDPWGSLLTQSEPCLTDSTAVSLGLLHLTIGQWGLLPPKGI